MAPVFQKPWGSLPEGGGQSWLTAGSHLLLKLLPAPAELGHAHLPAFERTWARVGGWVARAGDPTCICSGRLLRDALLHK